MMQQKTWCILLSVACAVMVFCAIRAARRPAASKAAQRIEVAAGRIQANEAVEDVEAIDAGAANEVQLRRLEAAGDAQQIRQQETANELRQRQQEATRPLSDNAGASMDDAGG